MGCCVMPGPKGHFWLNDDFNGNIRVRFMENSPYPQFVLNRNRLKIRFPNGIPVLIGYLADRVLKREK